MTGATISNARSIKGNTIFDWRVTFSNTGALDGSSVAQLRCVVGQAGRGRCQGPEVFTGSYIMLMHFD